MGRTASGGGGGSKPQLQKLRNDFVFHEHNFREKMVTQLSRKKSPGFTQLILYAFFNLAEYNHLKMIFIKRLD